MPVILVKVLMDKINNWVNKFLLAYPDKTERIVYLLIFLFPIAGMSVRHWITNIFNLLVLIGLFTLRKPREPLLREEKIFLWICVAYFSMFIISSLANGWGSIQTRYLGTELRFLLIIPLYIFLRRYPESSLWLFRGAVLGGFVLLSQAYYDVYIGLRGTAVGVYSKNIIGPFAIIISFWSLYYIWQHHKNIHIAYLIVILISVIAALTTAGISGSRGAYVGFIITSVACVMFFSKPRLMFASLAVISIIMLLFYQNSITVKGGVDVATNEVQQYFNAKDHTKDISSTTSTGVRLEMMRTGLLIIRDNPVLGIGPGNYNEVTQHYIKTNKANPAIGLFAHPHNTFFEVASAKGLIGLLTVLLLFYYPAYLYIKDYKRCKKTSVIGLIHVVSISAFSLTDHSVVLMNNYVSILLLGTAIFLSTHLRLCPRNE